MTVNYAAQARLARENRIFKFELGEYTTKFKNWEYSLTRQNRDPMFTIELKPSTNPGFSPSAEMREKLQAKPKRYIKVRFIFNEYSGFEDMLIFLEDLGCDLSTLPHNLKETKYQAIKDLLDIAEDKAPIIKVEVAEGKKPEYPNVYLREVPNIFEGLTTTAPVAPVTAPIAPAAPKATTGFAATPAYILENGVPVVVTLTDIPAKVAAGYTGQICTNGTDWVTLEAAGFVATPVATPPAPPTPSAPTPSAPAAPTPPAPVGTPAAPAAPVAPTVSETPAAPATTEVSPF